MDYLFSPFFLTTQCGIFVFVYVHPESVTAKGTRESANETFYHFL